MRVLIACEESGHERSAFIREGFPDTYSLDILPAADGHQNHHCADIVRWLYDVPRDYYSLIILHAPCTEVAISGNRWHSNTPQREYRIKQTTLWWNLCISKAPHVCLEQPITCLPELIYSRRQVVHPWNFYRAENKATQLHLFNLPDLEKPVKEKPAITHDLVWGMGPSDDRQKKRARLPWLAQPLAEQYGRYIREAR